jgi:glycosyltransferase involved in cell wall biosynthesis
MIRLTFLIPVFNEKKTVVEAINQIINLKFSGKEIIIIDNGSTDGSQDLIKKFTKRKNIRIVLRKKNIGYGNSLKQGARMAKGKYMYLHFSDIEYDQNVSIQMFKIAEKLKADAIFGSRLKNFSWFQRIALLQKKPAYVATFIITFMYNIFYNKNFTDVIGSKFYKTEIFKKIILKENSLTWSSLDFDLKNMLISGPYKIFEVFTKYKPRANNNEKKVKSYHLFFMLLVIIRFKLKNLIK